MKILLTGATGYIGKRLLPVLVAKGHNVVCAVRDTARFSVSDWMKDKIEVIELELLKKETYDHISDDSEVAF